jgi:methyl-accepting chemotaxis protein
MLPLRVVLAAVVVALATVAAGCGGSKDETTPTEQWASDLCTAVSTWKSSMTSIVSSVPQNGVTKDSLTNAVDQAKSDTKKLTDDLRKLGRPNTEAGKEAQSDVDQLASELDDGITKVEDAVDNASGAQGMLSAVSVIGSTLSTMAQQFKTTLTALEGLGEGQKEIKQAFQTVPACKELTSSST